MSVTDDIVEEIVVLCRQEYRYEFSHLVIYEDILESYASALITEIAEKLKTKGSTVGP